MLTLNHFPALRNRQQYKFTPRLSLARSLNPITSSPTEPILQTLPARCDSSEADLPPAILERTCDLCHSLRAQYTRLDPQILPAKSKSRPFCSSQLKHGHVRQFPRY